MKYLIGLDIGTSSVKGVLITTDGTVKKIERQAFVYTIKPGGIVEIPAKDYLNSCILAIKNLAKSADDEIIGVCASGATGNSLLLDEEDTPLTPIINWQDKRVTTEVDEIMGPIDKDAFYRQTGWPFSGKTMPLAHLCYWKKNMRDIYKKAKRVCMSTEYLYRYLTGNCGISTSAGTPFYLIDQVERKYISEILEKLEIQEDMLPPIVKCGEIIGKIKTDRAKECGLSTNTPVMAGSFDHPSAARGVGVLKEGQMLLSCGTSWVGFFPVNDRKKAADEGLLLDPFLSENKGPWGTMFSIASVSANLWEYVSRYIDNSEDAYSKLSALAKESPSGANGLRICPKDVPDDKLVKDYPKEDIARAIMEGMVELLWERIANIKENGICITEAVMVGGPSEDPMWRELISKKCNMPVKTVHGAYAGAVGAAILAGIGAGVYKDEQEAIERILKNE